MAGQEFGGGKGKVQNPGRIRSKKGFARTLKKHRFQKFFKK